MSTLNIAQVQELKEIMEDAFDDLVATYVQDSEDKLKLLKKEVGNADHQAICMLAHSLKGSSLNICAEDLALIFKQIEDSSRINDLSSIEPLRLQAMSEFDAVKVELGSTNIL
jgi:HPt (histidine-containing phosphotransfer) domain-containing protein